MRRLFLCFISILTLSTVLAQPQKSYKRGVGENNFNHVEEITALAPGITWTYNWGTNPSKYVAHMLRPGGEMEFIPMVWNGNFSEAAIRDSLDKYPGTKYLLGFNEPNFKSQANMTPTQAAELWPVLEGIAADYNLKLVSPALNFPDDTINDGHRYQPKEWLDGFINAYKQQNGGKEPQIDFIALHSYMNSPIALKGYISDFADTYHKKIWLTEFCSWEGQVDSISQMNAMVQKVQNLELDSMVYRYAWFKAKGTASNPFYRLLINQNVITHQPAWGTLSALGKIYVNMSSFDTTYYYQPSTVIPAKDYVNANGMMLEVNTDAASQQPIQISSFDGYCWAEYLIDVPKSGNYLFTFRLASKEFLYSPKIRVLLDGTILAEQEFNATGDTNNWANFTMTVPLTAGKQRIRILSARSTECKFNWFSFTMARGDVNGDGRVNVSDVTELINMILGIVPVNKDVADINNDNKVNVSDVTALINIILGVNA